MARSTQPPTNTSRIRTFDFETVLDRLQTRLRQHYFEVPEQIAKKVLEQGSRRVEVEIKGLWFRRALISVSEIGFVILIGKDLMKQLKLEPGDIVHMLLRADAEPDFLDVPEEFQAVLDTDADADARFHSLTLGMKRSLMKYVTQAKRSETRIKRSLQLAEKLKTHSLYSDRKKHEH